MPVSSIFWYAAGELLLGSGVLGAAAGEKLLEHKLDGLTG